MEDIKILAKYCKKDTHTNAMGGSIGDNEPHICHMSTKNNRKFTMNMNPEEI